MPSESLDDIVNSEMCVTMLLLHQCVIYIEFIGVEGKMGDYGLRREKKMHDVSEPYLM